MSSIVDTIAAVATPPGRGGVGIVRISGPAASTIAEQLLGRCPSPRYAEYLPFRDRQGAVIDNGIALFFKAPHSFTGEDVLELQGHGGPVVMDMLLEAVLVSGARLATPGEFSQRAYLNDKVDLAQAEAIADLIDSTSQQAARSALRSLQGEFSARVHALTEALIELRMFVESAIDFSDEEVDFLGSGEVAARLQTLQEQCMALRASAQQGCLLREGMTVVLVGRPNAGKSSLLNAIAGRDSAIVTEVPGTTRDVLREQIHLDGMPLHIIDTAGLRESADPIEQEGIRRAWGEIAKADRILLLVDDREGVGGEEQKILSQLPVSLPVTVVHNKIDLTGAMPQVVAAPERTRIYLSAKLGTGIDLLREHLQSAMGFQNGGEGVFLARRRHLEALERVNIHISAGSEHLLRDGAGELLAEELRLAQQACGEITGEFAADDLLGRIFASFCIGK